jgi:two-component system chemotaxis response regulator CheB
MFSTLTERGASSTLDALTHGASDYVTKPANVGSVATAQQRIRDEMIPKIKALCARHAPDAHPAPRPAATALRTATSRSVAAPVVHRVGVLAIGVSTGGPNALAALLPELPASLPVPVVIVQHMPPTFTKLLADRLSSHCHLTVREAAGGEVLAPGEAWIAPGDHHMTVVRRGPAVHLALNQDPHENSCRPAVDVLFRSVAETYRAQALALVLTGMGQDGLIGCEWIKERQGRVIVQDEKSSVVWGMPGFVARAGLADRVLPLDQIGTEILRAVAGGRDAAVGLHAAGAER